MGAEKSGTGAWAGKRTGKWRRGSERGAKGRASRSSSRGALGGEGGKAVFDGREETIVVWRTGGEYGEKEEKIWRGRRGRMLVGKLWVAGESGGV